MHHSRTTAAALVLLSLPLAAQITPSYTAPAPPPRPAAGVHAELDGTGPGVTGPEEGAPVILWDQTDFGFTAWVDQVFTDFPDSSSFQVADITTGVDEGGGMEVWRVSKVTTYFTQGIAGTWSPGTVTSGNLQVYKKTGPLPSDGSDAAPEYTVPVTLVDDGGFTWRVEADTSGIAELQCLEGEYWIGLTPITSYAGVGQEYHWTVSSIGDDSALRNPGGDFGLGTGWTGLGSIDTIAAGGPYEGAITLEGEVLVENWVDLGSALTSTFWGDDPLATGSGIACKGATVTISAFHCGPPFGFTTLVVGFLFPINAPFKGGTLVPNPDITLLLPTFAAGDFEVSSPWPPGVPPGIPFFFQFWQNEPPWSASNAIQVTSQ